MNKESGISPEVKSHSTKEEIKKRIAAGILAFTILGGSGCNSVDTVDTNESLSSSMETVIDSPESLVDSEVDLDSVPTSTVEKTTVPEGEINQNIQDFLNYQGDFTKEKISSEMIEIGNQLGETRFDLGLSDPGPKIEGSFLGYVDKGDVILMLMGFDGNDGNRFVTPVEIPTYFFEGYKKSVFMVSKLAENAAISNAINTDLSDVSKLTEFLASIEKTNIIVMLHNTAYPIDSSVKEKGQLVVDYVTELNSKVGLTYGLYKSVSTNGFEFNTPDNINPETSSILKIESIDDIDNIDISKVPVVFSLYYFKE